MSTSIRAAALAVPLAAGLTATVAFAQTAPPLPPAAPVSPTASAPQLPQINVVPPAPAASAPSPVAATPPTEKRGFLNEFGQWWDKSMADFKASVKSQQTQFDDLGKRQNAAAKDAASATQEAMKSAANAMVRMTTPSHMVEAQEVCPLAGNGAPDCAVAALNVCHNKGYKDGQPADIRTADKCTASLWVSGQPPSNGECPVETVMLRAACQ